MKHAITPATFEDIQDFPKEGIIFKNIRPHLENPKEFKNVIKSIAKLWEGKIDSIGMLDARGFIFGSMLAYEMELPMFMVRKKGKLPGVCLSAKYDLEYGSAEIEIEAASIKSGDRILIIDDVLATGGTAKAACDLVEIAGGKVAGVQVILELEALGGRNRLASYEANSIVQG
jgi:adenine phosphoribosyltransferase